MTAATTAQIHTLRRLWLRSGEDGGIPPEPWRRFRRSATRLIGGGGCIMVYWHQMYIGIEPDGHNHT